MDDHILILNILLQKSLKDLRNEVFFLYILKINILYKILFMNHILLNYLINSLKLELF